MLRVSIAGGSGYTGGELLRLLLFHLEVEIGQVTSNRLAGKPVTKAHPNLRKITDLKFCPLEELEPADLLFLCLPHGSTLKSWKQFESLAPRIIDLSADFRLKDEKIHRQTYLDSLPRPEAAKKFVYGIPELHRNTIQKARYVACAGCNATAVILGLYPLYQAGVVEADRTVVEVKVGSSEGGNRASDASHHPVRSGCLRSFQPTGHRHAAEISQELGGLEKVNVFFSATAVDQVRGILATCHLFLKEELSEKEVWKIYRKYYSNEPFIRIVKERDGLYHYPEPKLLSGTNFCDIGFERDAQGHRLVVLSAMDNLMKGAAGQAVQNMNLMCGFPEETALTFPGLHPV
jgi:N-acetyl-gamma-glutamyl-phosphate/LysW-gamma-L-alpha-aminoadipyl-6-phosphate reductase